MQTMTVLSLLAVAFLSVLALFASQADAAIDPLDQSALTTFYNGLTEKGILRWNTTTDLCRKSSSNQLSFNSFSVVVCDRSSPQKVTELHLSGFMLGGTFPSALSQLSSLVALSVDNNLFEGSLQPLTIPSLVYLNAENNQFSGTIPSVFGNMAYLQMLVLSSNNLVGPIPTELGLLKNLITLDLDNNTLASSIPTEFGGMSHLKILSIQNANLNGTIPAELGKLTNLVHLLLGFNQLQGSIPSQLGLMPSLFRMELNSNSLTGPIPSELGQLSELAEMLLENNALTGTIPTQLAGMVNMDTMDISGNHFSGTLPSFFDQLTYLTTLNLGSNNLTGSIPVTFPNHSNLRNLNLASNSLSGTIPENWVSFMKNLNLGAATNHFCPTANYSAWSRHSDFVPVDCSACSPFQCVHGECRYVSSQFTCECYAGYTGDLCDVRIACSNITETNSVWSGLSGENVTSTCGVGYTGSPSRICQTDGTWGPIFNPCTRITCSAVTEQNALFPLSNSLTQVTGNCVTGYTGSLQRSCSATGSWGSITGACTRNHCPATNESFVSWPKTDSLTTVSLVCPSGYSGSPSRYCEAAGTWGSISNPCIKITCENRTEGNAFWPTTDSLASANGTCASGYTGNPTRLCDQNGVWQAYTGSCIRLTCPNVTEANSTWTSTTSLSTVEGACSTGFAGPVSRTCLANGTWGAINGTCAQYQCLAQSFGFASWPNTNRSTTATGVCDPGYTGTPRRPCSSTGVWGTVSPICNRLLCPRVMESIYKNGTAPYITWVSSNSLTNVTGSCATGFTGTPTRYCSASGTWSTTSGSCTAQS